MTGHDEEKKLMDVQLDADEVQTAVTEYLRRRGALVDETCRVRLDIVDRGGSRLNIVGCAAVVVATNVKLPGEPYR